MTVYPPVDPNLKIDCGMPPLIYLSLNFMYNAGSGGVTDVAENLSESLQELEGQNVAVVRPSNKIRNQWLRRFLRFFSELWIAPRLPSGATAVVLYPNYFFSPFRRRRIKQVVLVHDLQFILYPQYTSKMRMLWLNSIFKVIKARADGVVFISRSTRDDFIRQYGTPKRYAVIYNPVFVQNGYGQDETQPVDRPYAIANFHFYPHKNFKKVLSVFSTVQKWQPAVKLVMTGKTAPAGTNEAAMLKSDSVVHLGFLPKAEVYNVINGCDFFISMSEFEGFNMSAAESAKAGKPLILSDIPIHRELFSGWAFFIRLDDEHFPEEELKSYLENFDRSRTWDYAARTDGPQIAREYVDFLKSVI